MVEVTADAAVQPAVKAQGGGGALPKMVGGDAGQATASQQPVEIFLVAVAVQQIGLQPPQELAQAGEDGRVEAPMAGQDLSAYSGGPGLPQQLRLSGRGRLQSDDHRLVAELPGSAG